MRFEVDITMLLQVMIPVFTLLAGWFGQLFWLRHRMRTRNLELVNTEFNTIQEMGDEISKIHKEMIVLRDQIRTMDKDRHDMETEIAKLRLQLDEAIRHSAEKDKKIASMERKISLLKAEITKLSR